MLARASVSSGIVRPSNETGICPNATRSGCPATTRGFALEMIAAVSQGWKLNSAIKTAERKLAGGELVHGGSSLMAWCVGNAKAEQKGNGVMITKQAAGSAKIDPMMAMFNAVTLMALNPEAGTRQIRQGFVSL